MADRAPNDVQLEHGHVRIANRLYEAMLDADFTATQFKILHGIIRLSYGWRRKTVMISHPELARAVHLAPSGTFRSGLRELVTEGVVLSLQRGLGHETSVFAIQKDFTQWGRFSVSPEKLEHLYGARPTSDDALLNESECRKSGIPSETSAQIEAGRVAASSQSEGAKVVTPTGSKSKRGKGPKGRKDKKDIESNWVSQFGDDWVAAKKGTAPYARIGRVLKPLIEQYTETRVREHWLRFVASEKSRFGPEYFANNFGDYLAEVDVSAIERARTLIVLYREHDLLNFSGNRKQYAEAKKRAADDPRAGATFDADFAATRPWEREVGALPEPLAIKELARRLDTAHAASRVGTPAGAVA